MMSIPGVTEERILENARIAAKRLKPLGLSIMEVDLGWERRQLPNARPWSRALSIPFPTKLAA